MEEDDDDDDEEREEEEVKRGGGSQPRCVPFCTRLLANSLQSQPRLTVTWRADFSFRLEPWQLVRPAASYKFQVEGMSSE